MLKPSSNDLEVECCHVTARAARRGAAPVFESLEHRQLLAGVGLAGAYYARVNHTLSKFARVDALIDTNWTGGTPAASLGTDGFSVRWSGQVMPKFSEAYTFLITSAGGARVWVNEQLLIDDWEHHSAHTRSGTLSVLAGQLYDIRIDYWSDGTDPSAKLEWQSKRLSREVVPSNRLFADALDAESPTAPPRFRATFASDSVIKVIWNEASDPSGVVAYDMYVGGGKVHTTAPGETFYIRRSLLPETDYQFSVQAVDAAGNVSEMVHTAVTTAERRNVGPTVPGNVRVTGLTTDSLTLEWDAATDDKAVVGYRIYRNGVKLPVAPTGTSFTDTGLSPDTSYSYTVRATDAESVFSEYSAAATARTDSLPSHDPYAGILARDYNASSGVTRGSNEITSLDDGDWVRYDDVDFGGGANSIQFLLSLNPTSRGGTIEVRLSSPGGTLLATHVVQPTGSFSTYNSQKLNIGNVTGVHDVVLVFKGRSGVANLRSITFSSQRLTRIMALGDSITHASTATSSYRYYLWQLLQNAGYKVDFVGGQTAAWNGDPPNFGFDQNHEGHANWRADEIAQNAANWAAASVPDIVLLHAGTNDIRQGQGVADALSDLGAIIDALRSVNPNVTILLAQLIPAQGSESQIDDLNSQIPGLAASMNNGQSQVIVVDQNSGFSLGDTFDGLHPNDGGEGKMANRWFSALQGIL